MILIRRTHVALALSLVAAIAARTSAQTMAAAPQTSASAESRPEPESNVRLQALVGFGAGTRSFYRPTRDGAQELPETAFPVLDVGVRARLWPEARFSLTALVRYQTSVGFVVEEPALFALPTELGVRDEHLEAGIAPTFRFGKGPMSPGLALPMGVMWRAFVSHAYMQKTPSYSLAGPHLRAELQLPISNALQLRVGPELQWLVAIKGTIRPDGVAATGVALGAEASLQLQITDRFGVELMLRQSSAFASGKSGQADFEDVERFAIMSLSGSL